MSDFGQINGFYQWADTVEKQVKRLDNHNAIY